MKSPLQQFRDYVKQVGGRAQAAERLGISVGMVSHILCDRRGISPQIAMAIDSDTDGVISKASLRPDLWTDDTHS